jgi:hypothetical protein
VNAADHRGRIAAQSDTSKGWLAMSAATEEDEKIVAELDFVREQSWNAVGLGNPTRSPWCSPARRSTAGDV